MKIFALFLAIVAIAQAKQTFVTSKALHVRGGGSLGPLDDIVGNMGSAAVASYVGASAAKIVAGQAGGNAPAVSNAKVDKGLDLQTSLPILISFVVPLMIILLYALL